MVFRELKSGSQVFIFNKPSITVSIGTINSVSTPRVNTQNPLQAGLVVDITITADGKVGNYTVPEGSVICNINNEVSITPNRENLVQELQGAKLQSEEILKNIDFHKKVVSKCDELLAEYDSTFKEKQEVNQRITAIEQGYKAQNELLQKLLTSVNDLTEKLK